MNINQFAEQSAIVKYTYRITPGVYYSFQRCSNDYNPLHTDTVYATNKGFKGQVMYGNILNAFVSHFVGMLLPVRNVVLQSQEINFHKPVYLNDELSFESQIVAVSETSNFVRYKFVFRRIDGENRELVARGIVQVGLFQE